MGDFSQQEIDALKSFVLNGGGLLLLGLGWSWELYNPGRTLDEYPMNILGEIFGIRWTTGYISDPTNNYNGQPIFHTFYPNIELQTIYQAFSYTNEAMKRHPQDLPFILQYNSSFRERYVKAHLILATATMDLSASSKQRLEIYDFYRNLISSNPQYFNRNLVYDKNTQSVMAWIRERAYRSFINTLLYGEGLTAEKKAEIAATLRLTGRYYDIWNDFSVLLLDNAGLNERQKTFIYNLLNLIPKELHNLHSISVVDNLGKLPYPTPEITLGGKDDGVNIFGFDIRVYSENGFPEDVPAKYSDVFCLVVVHEVNHVVDAFFVSRNATLKNRKDELIKRAGASHMNYLRSMLPDGFFVSVPQEFLASIANQWFANTTHTLKLALVRFDRGYKEPLNQFLFFADVYSRGGKTTFFYTINVEGNMQRKEVRVLRDNQGRIIGLVDGKMVYRFTLDSEDNIESYFVSLDTIPPTIKAAIPEPSLQLYSTTLTVTYTGIDELSGIDHYEIRLDEGMWINMGTITSYTFKDLKAGSHTVYIKVIDKAGNINTTCTLFTIVTLTQTSTTTATMTQTTPIITTTTMITTLTPVVTTTVTPTQTNMILITIIIAIIIWIAFYYIIKHKITK
jgi:hypothetical protein